MGEQHERLKVRRPCVAYLRAMRDKNQLKRYQRIYVVSPPDLGKIRPWVAAQHKLDGYEKGVFDMTIIAANDTAVKVWLIEFKWGKNGYTKEQKAIADSFEGTPVETVKIYSQDEFIEFVNKELR